MRMLIVCALALPMMGCASGSLSLDPADMHLAVGLGAGAYQALCLAAGKTDFCSKQNQKRAAAAQNAANGAIDSLPSSQQ